MKLKAKISFFTKKYLNDIHEYKKKMEEYQRNVDTEDPILTSLKSDMELPREPEMDYNWCDINVMDSLIIGYHILPMVDDENLVEVILRSNEHTQAYYIINFDDNIIKNLDEIIKENN